jgi:hypothetical protein
LRAGQGAGVSPQVGKMARNLIGQRFIEVGHRWISRPVFFFGTNPASRRLVPKTL